MDRNDKRFKHTKCSDERFYQDKIQTCYDNNMLINNKQRSFKPFMCLDLVLEYQQSFLLQICLRNNKKHLFIYKRVMANTSAIWQQAAHTTYHQSTRTILKGSSLKRKFSAIFLWGKSVVLTTSRKRTRQEEVYRHKHDIGHRKGNQSNDSPEIPDRRMTSDVLCLTSGLFSPYAPWSLFPELYSSMLL